jgi:hypothetical protein
MNHAMTFVVKRLVLQCCKVSARLRHVHPLHTPESRQTSKNIRKRLGKSLISVTAEPVPCMACIPWTRTILNSCHRRFQVFRQAVLVDIFHDDLTDLTHQRFVRETLNAVKNCLVWLWTLWCLFGHLAALPIYSLAMSSECCYTRWKEWRWWDVRACSREIF